MTPDLLYIPDFIDDHVTLLDALIEGVEWDERMRARKTASFGVPYNYSGMTYPTAAFPARFVPILNALEATLGFRPNNCLLNLYPDGKSRMGFHYDSIEELVPGTGVAIVSLGAQRVLEYQLITDRSVTYARPLPSGSMLYMDDDVQRSWLHGIPKAADVNSPRISCTFRCLRQV